MFFFFFCDFSSFFWWNFFRSPVGTTSANEWIRSLRHRRSDANIFFTGPCGCFSKFDNNFYDKREITQLPWPRLPRRSNGRGAKIMITWLFLPFARRKHVKLKDLRVYTHKLADTKKISIFVIEHFFCNKYADFLKTKKNSVKKKSTIFFKICLFIT